MKRLSIIPLAVFAFTPLSGATAQEQRPAVEPGARVRVTAPSASPGRLEGTVVTLTGEDIVVDQRGGDQVTIPLQSVTLLEVSRGRKSKLLLGLGLGFVGGAGAGAAIIPERCGLDFPEAGCRAVGATVGAVGGALFGAIVGALIKTERWEEVPLDQLRVSFAPQRDGRFGVGVSVSF